MDSFNVFGHAQTSKTIGGNTPIWLGTVKPVPVGAIIDDNVREYAPNGHIPAGVVGKFQPVSNFFVPYLTATEALSGEPNAYMYNDIYSEATGYATCAVVMHHPEGLLIERVYPEITEEQIAQLQAKIPGVLLVRG